jgi:hypothetical protein
MEFNFNHIQAVYVVSVGSLVDSSLPTKHTVTNIFVDITKRSYRTHVSTLFFSYRPGVPTERYCFSSCKDDWLVERSPKQESRSVGTFGKNAGFVSGGSLAEDPPVFSLAVMTHPDIASLVHPLFAARKKGNRKGCVNGA